MTCMISHFADWFLCSVTLLLSGALTTPHCFYGASLWNCYSSTFKFSIDASALWLNTQCPAVSNMLRALQAQNICRLLAINLLLRPFITSNEKLCLFDVKRDNSSQIASVCQTTPPCSYLTLPGAMRGTRGRRANLKVSTVYFSIWIHFTFFLWGCRSERSEAIEWEAWGERGNSTRKTDALSSS